MNSNDIISMMIIVCIGVMSIVIFLEPIKKIFKILLNGIIGLVLIYLSNLIFVPLGISVGINIFTLAISAFLGFPGVVAVFAIQAIL